MSHKMTISCKANLADVELEEGLCVLVQDSGTVYKCIASVDGRLLWQMQSATRYDFPETSTQLQEIEFEDARTNKLEKSGPNVIKHRYLH